MVVKTVQEKQENKRSVLEDVNQMVSKIFSNNQPLVFKISTIFKRIMRAEILYYCMIKKRCSRQSEKVVFYAHFSFYKVR